MYFHLTGSPSEHMSVQLQTLQMHNKIINMILCQSKGLWLKQEGQMALKRSPEFCLKLTCTQ